MGRAWSAGSVALGRLETRIMCTRFSLKSNLPMIVLLLCITCRAFAAEVLELTDDGGWCWFQDERAVILDGRLVVGCVAMGRTAPDSKGDVQAIVLDLDRGDSQLIELHDRLGADDHNAPAFTRLPGNRLLAVYATHGRANAFWYRISAESDPTVWGPPHKFVPTGDSSITYANVFCLSAEQNRVFNFYRGYANSFKPSYAYSDDNCRTWNNGGVFIHVPGPERHRPYVKYASNGIDTIHIVYTNGHPRNYDNSLYHIYYRGGMLHDSHGKEIAPLAEGLARPDLGTLIFTGDAAECGLALRRAPRRCGTARCRLQRAEGRPAFAARRSLIRTRPSLPVRRLD